MHVCLYIRMYAHLTTLSNHYSSSLIITAVEIHDARFYWETSEVIKVGGETSPGASGHTG